MRIKKSAAMLLAGMITFSAPSFVYGSEEDFAIAEEILESNEISSLISDPDKIVDIILYVKEYLGNQDISDDMILEAVNMACDRFSIRLEDSEKETLVSIFKEFKDMDLDEEELRKTVNEIYDGLRELGIGEEEVKSFLQKALDFVKDLF